MREADYYESPNTYVRISSHSFLLNYLFQQDGAPLHKINVVHAPLDSLFPDSWIVKHGSNNWHPRSPDSSHLDFLVRRFVQDEVFRTPVRNITQLKRRIIRTIGSIQQEAFQKAWEHLEN